MAHSFHCSVDGREEAILCCTCYFPLPCLCQDCALTHCSQSGETHNLLPVTVKAEIASRNDFLRLQRKLYDLDLMKGELKVVRAAVEIAKGKIQTAYQEIEDSLRSTRDKYLTKLSNSADLYEEKFKEAMEQCRNNAWRGADFCPADLAGLLWKHTPGQEPNFGFTFQQFVQREQVEKLFNVKWLLPFPALSYPEEGFPIKVDIGADRVNVIVERSQTVAEVKWFLKNQFPQLPSELKLFHKGMQLLDNGTLQCMESGDVLSMDQPHYYIVNSSTSDEFIISAQGHSRSIESLTLRLQDRADLPEVILKIPPKAPFRLEFHLNRPIQINVEVMATGHLLLFGVSSSETILALKHKIRESEGIRPNGQVLMYGGSRLKDERTMESYGISQNSTLQLREETCLTF